MVVKTRGEKTTKLVEAQLVEPMRTFTCCDCGREKAVETNGGTGYALVDGVYTVCYDCCGVRDGGDLAHLPLGERMILYLAREPKIGTWILSNWPGTLFVAVGRHKVSKMYIPGNALQANRIDLWFTYCGNKYWGVQYGDNTQLVWVRKIA